MADTGKGRDDSLPSWLAGSGNDLNMSEAMPLDVDIFELCSPLCNDMPFQTSTQSPKSSSVAALSFNVPSSVYSPVSPSASLSPSSPLSSCMSSPEWSLSGGVESWAYPALVEGMAEARAGGGAALAALVEELENSGDGSECTVELDNAATAWESQPPTKKRKRSSEVESSGLPACKELNKMSSDQLAALKERLGSSLTPEEDARLAASWRRVKNREYSRVSRAKKSKRLEVLEARVQALEEEKRQLQVENKSLREKLYRIAAAFQEARSSCGRAKPSAATAAAGVCLFAVLLCVGLVGLTPLTDRTHEAALAGRMHRTGRTILTSEESSSPEEPYGIMWVLMWWQSVWWEGDSSIAVMEDEYNGSTEDGAPLSIKASAVRNRILEDEQGGLADKSRHVLCTEESCTTEAWAANCSSASVGA